jgi:hypothetical protein
LVKIIKIFFKKKFLFFNKVIIAILILFFYLLFLDLFLSTSINKNYFFTLALNIIMFTMILDEFKNNTKLRDNSLLLFLLILLLISLFVNNNFLSLAQSSGRITFLYLNHNTFSFILLLPLFFLFIFIITRKQTPNKIMNYFLYFFIFINLVNSIINSGSRFPVYIIFLFYLLLLLFVMSYFWKLNSFNIFFIFISLAYFLYKVTTSDILFLRIFEEKLILDEKFSYARLLMGNMSSGRSELIILVKNITFNHEFFGVGASNFFYLMNGNLPHNIFLEIYGSGGLIGVYYFLLLHIYYAWTFTWKNLIVINLV